jgi:protoheme IX farnesyltransferase
MMNGSAASVRLTNPIPLDESSAPGVMVGAGAQAWSRPATGTGTGSVASVARAAWHRIGAYVALTKPRVIELLLVTTLPTMILAQHGFPSVGLVLATLVGGSAAAGASGVLNCYLDRDIDEIMNRTRRRPLVTGEVSPRAALVFGLVLAVGSLLWFGLLVNAVAAALTFAAIAIYVVGYTMILKRRTPQNIVWGGAAGCMPVLIGWSAVTGSVSWVPFVLFGVVFFWTPPHYWPLSMKFRRDYVNAGVPMLPVVATDTKVAREMIAYTVAMIACSLLLVPVAGMSWVYGVVALALGVWFMSACVGLLRRAQDPSRGKLGAMKVFHASITYLTLLSVAIAVDVFLPF